MGERAGFLLQILESCKDNSCSFYSITGANNVPILDKRATQAILKLHFAQDY